MLVLDASRHVKGVNTAAEKILRVSASSLLGYSLEEVCSGQGAILTLLDAALSGGRAVTLRDMIWTGRDQATSSVDLTVTPLIDDEGQFNGWILLIRDLTQVKSLENEVRQADRLAMMGTIAAGLAHEIKNPLGGIRGAAQLLERENLSPEARECVGIIVRETDRVNRLISELLKFTRPKKTILVPLNLNQLLDEVLLRQKEPLKEKNIRVIRDFDPSLPSVLGSEDELHKVFLNLIQNAMDAVPETKGEIRVCSKILTDYKIKGAGGAKPSMMVAAEIRDNGAGISPENLARIFTPFFTTKEKGYGLGLAISQRIVKEHGGSLLVQSGTKKAGGGTTMQVVLRSCS